MKKKMIALLYVLIMFATFSIGFATWVFSSDVHFDPNYAPQAEFDFSKQSSVYDGTVKDVVYPNEEFKNMIVTNYETPFISKKDGVIVDSLTEMKDVGIYEMTFKPKAESVNQYEEFSINYEISKRTLGFKYVFTNRNDKTDVKRFDGPNIRFDSSINSVYDLDFEYTNIVNSDDVSVSTDITEFIAPSITQKVLLTLKGSKKDNYSLAHSEFNVEINASRIKIKFDTPVIEIDYDENTSSFDLLQQKIINEVKNHIVDATTNQKVSLIVSLDFIHNGEYLYTKNNYNYNDVNPIIGYKPKNPYDPNVFGANYKNVIGSTYEVYINYEKNKYELMSPPIILKYKTAKIENTFYTIEDALDVAYNTGGAQTVYTVGSNASYITTSFCKLNNNLYNKNNYEISNRDTLFIPYEERLIEVNPKDGDSNATPVIPNMQDIGGSDKPYSTLIIPDGITLNVNGNSNIAIGGKIKSGLPESATVLDRGVLVNNGIINLNNSSIRAYGFLKGTGMTYVKNKSSILDVFKIYDWKGGTNTVSIYTGTTSKLGWLTNFGNGVFPVSTYSFHNISSKIDIDQSSHMSAIYRLSMGGEHLQDIVCLIGQENKKLGLFTLNNANGHITKYAQRKYVEANNIIVNDELNTNIVMSNQLADQQEVIETYGDFNDNPVKITVKVIFSVDVSTSTTMALPVGFMKIHIKEGKGKLRNSSFKFLPGSELIIDEGASLDIDSQINVVAYGEEYANTCELAYDTTKYSQKHDNWFQLKDERVGAKIVNNGFINAYGGFGGVITTENKNNKAGIVLAKESATVKDFDHSKPDVTASKMHVYTPRGYLHPNGNIENLNDSTKIGHLFVSNTGSPNNYWVDEGPQQSITFNLHLENGGADVPITYYLGSDVIEFVFDKTVYTPIKNYKDFYTWTIDKVGGINADNHSFAPGNTYQLFANYTDHVFTLDYSVTYNNQRQDTTGIYENVKFTFNDNKQFVVNGVVQNSLTLNSNDHNFNGKQRSPGWFYGYSGKHSYIPVPNNQITPELFEKHVNQLGNIDLPVVKLLYDRVITVKPDKNDTGYNDLLIYYADGEDFADLVYLIEDYYSQKDDDITYKYYFDELKIGNLSSTNIFDEYYDMTPEEIEELKVNPVVTLITKNKFIIHMNSDYTSYNMLRVTINSKVYEGKSLNKTVYINPKNKSTITIEVGNHFGRTPAPSIVTVKANGKTFTQNSISGSNWDVMDGFSNTFISSDMEILCRHA